MTKESKDWISEIADEMNIDCLPENYQEVAEIVGMEAALRLAQHLGGGRIYYPKIESLLRDKRDAKIRAEFTGFNHRELARHYGLTESWVREIIHRRRSDQLTLFPDSDS